MKLDRLPLPSLLSHVLVAFTIEADNEFERRMPHRTSRHGATGGAGSPWNASLAMWFGCMRFVDERGVAERELKRLARAATNLNGMVRWGYVDVAGGTIFPTRAGLQAREVWQSLCDEIETRWRSRFGSAAVDATMGALREILARVDRKLPDFMPILGHGLAVKDAAYEGGREDDDSLASCGLVSLLSKVLLSFTLDYERDCGVSLAISANLFRILGDDDALRVRDLPLRTGISKEAIAMALSWLQKRDYVTVEPLPRSRTNVVRLTAKGRKARAEHVRRLAAVENEWSERYGAVTIARLRDVLERLVGDAEASGLLECIEPHAGGWRAAVASRTVFPHQATVLHRGGFPDGA